MSRKKIAKLDEIKFLIEEATGVGVSDNLLEEIYDVINGEGINLTELQERVKALEEKVDTINPKLDRVARRLG